MHKSNVLYPVHFTAFFIGSLSTSPEKWNSSKLLSKEWMRGQILKEAGKELDLMKKNLPMI